jgi:L-ascorbate metabolism protein UlaG (beta-lactamase superfamily)
MTPARSDHFNGKTFFDPQMPSDHGFTDLLRWKLTSRPAAWPRAVAFARAPLPRAPATGIAATWIGQSTYLLRGGGLSVITDPIFSAVAGPVSWAGPRRVAPPGVDLRDLPRIDAILLSHDHYDHCDLRTLGFLARRDTPRVYAPLGHGSLLRGVGLTTVTELDWWESAPLGADATVTFVPAQHWCRRSPFATNTRLWGGHVLRMAGRSVYFVGDSGYREGLFTRVRERVGAPDLALVPIGAYEPRWFMKDAHMNPHESVLVHRETGARVSAAMHWGTFQLTDEAYDAPVIHLRQAQRALEVPEAEFRVPAHGETLVV